MVSSTLPDISSWESAYSGARWFRVDLHLHSPASCSFKVPNESKEIIVQDYIQQLSSQHIGIAAITDYQQISLEWFPALEAEGSKHGIVLFPGVEISFRGPKHGLHVLAIFPVGSDIESINREIYSLDRVPSTPLIAQDRRHRDIDCSDIVEALCNLRRNTECLLVLPHPDDGNGLNKSFRLQDACEFVRNICPDGIESFDDAARRRMASSGVIDGEILEKIACLEFSDPKNLADIGTKTRPDGQVRATYLKISDPKSVTAVRLCFHDSELLTCLGGEPTAQHTHVVAVGVEGTGFLGNMALFLSPDLNTFIGSRGSGKSAILETIRFVLGLGSYEHNAYRDGLPAFALGSGGKATLYVQKAIKPGVSRLYRFERVWGEPARVFELNPEVEVDLAPLQVLSDQDAPLFFGQKELYAVTSGEKERLDLLDDIIGRKARSKLDDISRMASHIDGNAALIMEKEEELLQRDELERELSEIRHEIELYKRLGVAQRIAEATALTSDEESLVQVNGRCEDGERATGTIQQARADWVAFFATLRDSLALGVSSLSRARSSRKDLLGEGATAVQELLTCLDGLQKTGLAHIESAEERLDELFRRWREERRPLDEQLRQIKLEMGSEALDADRLIELTQRQVSLQPQLERLDAVRVDLARLQKERVTLLGDLQRARHDAFRLRQEQARLISEFLGSRVRVEVLYKGQRKAFRDELVQLFQGSKVDGESIGKIADTEGIDGQALADIVADGVDAVQEKLGLTAGRAKQVCAFLGENREFSMRLQRLAPDDEVEVYLVVNGKSFSLASRSAGEKATAMLLILLAQEERLLFLDQPEDDLDNRFVYDDIVRILREQKGKRQLLIATHNPNIPVLGHAESIIALEGDDAVTTVAAHAAIDKREVQEAVKQIMEGGETALRRRAEKYGWF